MANASPSRLGQTNGSGDVQQLFKEVYTGEVITAFDEVVTLKERTTHRTIPFGKSASFPAVYKASTGYHTPGAELTGSSVLHNEVIITIDDLLVSDIFLASIDEAMNYFEVRSKYSYQQGRALAVDYDKNIARNLVLAARKATLFTGDSGGTSVTDANARTSVADLAQSIWEGKQGMDEVDVPVDMDKLYCAVKPAQWYLLASDTTLIQNADIRGGEGHSYTAGTFSMIGGVEVIKSNAYPWGTDDSSNTDLMASNRVDMTNTAAVLFTEEAAATVQLMGLNFEIAPDPRRRGSLLIAEYAVGHGAYVPKTACEIKVA